jgi:hypothetical protein
MELRTEMIKKLAFAALFSFSFSLVSPEVSSAEVIQLTSSTVGKRLTADYQHAPFIMLGPSVAPFVAVWVKKVPQPSNGSDPCPTGLTGGNREGMRFSSDPTDKYPVGWLYKESLNTVWCGILESGSVTQSVYVSD